MNANLLLKAMTLRGIGSYLHGSRLEFRPLTILCGTNGSGKSTWFKALNLLKESLATQNFPFEFSKEDYDAGDIETTNALIHLLFEGESIPATSANKSVERKFGPPCTIGLQFEAVKDFSLQEVPQRDASLSNELQDFFWLGKCKQGTKFDVRIAHPSSADFGEEKPGLWHFIELRIDEGFVIRYKSAGCEGNEDANFYLVSCSAGFLPQLSRVDDEAMVKIGAYDPKLNKITSTADMLDEDEAKRFIQTAISRIRELVKMMLDGFFYISAIRQPFLQSCVNDSMQCSWELAELEKWPQEEKREAKAMIKSRHVGSEGKNAWPLELFFAQNMMSIEDTGGKVVNDMCLERYVSKWSESLLNTKVVQDESDVDTEPLSKDYPDSPIGFLMDEKPVPYMSDFYSDHTTEKLVNPCFPAFPQSPKQMSSGFHQLFPLIVQTGLMRRHEFMAVENPEVHLHPSLQLSVAEFLIQQAKAGKWIVIETHSDLIIRRVLRAILEEEIPQQKVQIYFADIEKSYEYYPKIPHRVNYFFHYSTLNPIEINDQGRIKNWPPGFMDDDVKESQRLLDIMYGGPPDEVEDDE